MTAEQITKALEDCFQNDWHKTKCNECPFYTATAKCMDDLKDSAIELINYQKQEIEELEAEVSTAKLEAVKEFTGKAKSKLGDLEYNSRTNRKTIPIEKHDEIVDWILHEVVLNMVSELEKEMVEMFDDNL